MNTQLIWMGLLCIICWASAIDWFIKGEYPNAIAFFVFGIGDMALAWALRGGVGD